jgi:hypothetical protein
MAGLPYGGVNAIQYSVATQPAQGVTLRPGAVYQATVGGAPENPTLVIGNTVLGVRPMADIQPGQQVQVEIMSTGERPQLRILQQGGGGPPAQPGGVANPGAAAPGAAAAPSLPAAVAGQAVAAPQEIAQALARVLGTLGASRSAADAMRVIPRAMPPAEGALRSLMRLFFSRVDMGEGLARLRQILAQAAGAGVLQDNETEALGALLARLVVNEDDDLMPALRQLARQASSPVEARIAQAVASGRMGDLIDVFAGDLRAQLAALRENPALVRYLDGQGLTGEFRGLLDALTERLEGGHLQNLRSLDLPYLFLEIPFDPQGPLRQGQLHLFGDSRQQGRGFDRDNALVVLDLSTDRHGDLWVSMQVTQAACACTFRATEPALADAINAAASDLSEALAAAGYPNAQVQARLWDGDRLGELAAVLGPSRGIDLEA